MTEEKTPEKIVLPRSGMALPRVTLHESGRADYGDEDAAWMSVDVDGWSYAMFLGKDVDGELPRDDMIRLLDTCVLSLRSALLKGAEETVAQAMWAHDEWNPRTLAEADTSNVATVRAGATIYRDRARAVLAALCGEEWK